MPRKGGSESREGERRPQQQKCRLGLGQTTDDSAAGSERRRFSRAPAASQNSVPLVR